MDEPTSDFLVLRLRRRGGRRAAGVDARPLPTPRPAPGPESVDSPFTPLAPMPWQQSASAPIAVGDGGPPVPQPPAAEVIRAVDAVGAAAGGGPPQRALVTSETAAAGGRRASAVAAWTSSISPGKPHGTEPHEPSPQAPQSGSPPPPAATPRVGLLIRSCAMDHGRIQQQVGVGPI